MNNQFSFTRLWFSIAVIICFISINQLTAQPNFPTKTPDRIILNATEDPSVSMAATWRTDTSVNEGYAEIQVATAGPVNADKTNSFKAITSTETYSSQNNQDVSSNHHSVIFTDLRPGQKYIYRVGNDEDWSEWFQFETPTREIDEFTFIYLGDPQNELKSQWSRVVREAYKTTPESSFMLYGGDMINQRGSDIEWHEWFYATSFIAATIPQLMTPGNHDYGDFGLDSHWNKQFTLPMNGPESLTGGPVYYVDYKNLRLISFDTELQYESVDAREIQKRWLEKVLAENTKEWTIVVTHYPFYATKADRDGDEVREHFQPILEKYNVDMVLTGHDHAYGRGTASDNPEITPSIVYVVSVSGPKQYPKGDKEWMQQSLANTLLHQTITINKNFLSYKAYDTTGKLVDAFNIKKRKSGKNKFFELKPKN